MALMRITSPHAVGRNRTRNVMLTVAAACLPGLLAMVYFFGPGVLTNLLLVCGFALAFEAASLKIRQRPVGFFLKDGSALLTGVLLALALPPYSPWWLLLVGAFFAIVIAKHLYGGLGFNPFNPAMVAYVVLLIAFPLPMTQWAAPGDYPGLAETLSIVFAGASHDSYTGATALDLLRQNSGLLLDDLYAQTPLLAQGQFAARGYEWVNLGFLAGGLFLLQQRLFSWHAPVAMLATLGLLSALFYDGGSSGSAGSPLFHWLSGGTMLGAFFIVTDPVTGATSNKGRLIFGAGVGLLVFCIRSWGNYPDAVAFAVLLMNFAAPFIDFYTLPRTYGHARAKSAREKTE